MIRNVTIELIMKSVRRITVRAVQKSVNVQLTINIIKTFIAEVVMSDREFSTVGFSVSQLQGTDDRAPTTAAYKQRRRAYAEARKWLSMENCRRVKGNNKSRGNGWKDK